MKLGTVLEHIFRNNFGYRGISDLSSDGCGGHFEKWPTSELSMSHISANNGDRNLNLVSIPMFSYTRNPNLTRFF